MSYFILQQLSHMQALPYMLTVGGSEIDTFLFSASPVVVLLDSDCDWRLIRLPQELFVTSAFTCSLSLLESLGMAASLSKLKGFSLVGIWEDK